jgi:hypothetical protein
MAAIALARSVLEYSILDNAKRLGLDPVDPDNPRRTKKLGELVGELTLTHPGLDESMNYLVSQGNFVMHPERGNKILSYPARKAAALKCVDHIRRVTEELYKGT